VACGGDNTNGSSPAGSGGGRVSGTIQGSGSTFQSAYQEEALVAFQDDHHGTTVTYGGGGSGKGSTDLKGKTVDFAGSDSPYAEADKPTDPVLYFPILLGAITISYNVEGVDHLQLSGETIAKIFQRDITTWDDPAIAADNPGARLPSAPIVVAHRSDGSGTTDNFTKYLDAAAPGVWRLKSGSTVEWPADTQAGSGNAGVAQIIKDNKGAVGYVDLSDATAAGLKTAAVKNKAGTYVEASADSASAAGDGITVKPDLTFAAINADGEKSYPITYQTWVIVYQKQPSAGKGALLKAYLNYLLTDGQKMLAELDFAPLPTSIRDKAVAQLAQIQVG
jgi:phosphate transport system substrate-binding protein